MIKLGKEIKRATATLEKQRKEMVNEIGELTEIGRAWVKVYMSSGKLREDKVKKTRWRRQS